MLDRLGRNLFAGDYVSTFNGYLGKVQIIEFNRVLVSIGNFLSAFDSKDLTIKLALSPERNNYERYFSDLGTIREINSLRDECCDMNCETCAFRGFNGDDIACAGFSGWLEDDCAYSYEVIGKGDIGEDGKSR